MSVWTVRARPPYSQPLFGRFWAFTRQAERRRSSSEASKGFGLVLRCRQDVPELQKAGRENEWLLKQANRPDFFQKFGAQVQMWKFLMHSMSIFTDSARTGCFMLKGLQEQLVVPLFSRDIRCGCPRSQIGSFITGYWVFGPNWELLPSNSGFHGFSSYRAPANGGFLELNLRYAQFS